MFTNFLQGTGAAPKIIAIGCAALLCATGTYAAGATLNVSAQPGWNIFTGGGDNGPTGAYYRYGPSIIINADKSIDLWTTSPGSDVNGNWDYIRYKRSTDGGITWGPESVALAPTAGSSDALSTADPGVVYFGGYYYIGYTSTQDPSGVNNGVYVARSTSPDSGFQKWNGSGWGGDPQPFISFTGTPGNWGAGEPSFVAKNGTLYVYYSWLDPYGTTRVATVPTSDPNWPAHLTSHGTAAIHWADDSMDVKYIDALNEFIGVSVNNRFSSGSNIDVWESQDGLTFTSIENLTANIQDWASNSGISGTPDGHLDLNDNNFVAYAYSPNNTLSWAQWYTFLNPITVVPEPGALSILCLGALPLLFLSRRRWPKRL